MDLFCEANDRCYFTSRSLRPLRRKYRLSEHYPSFSGVSRYLPYIYEIITTDLGGVVRFRGASLDLLLQPVPKIYQTVPMVRVGTLRMLDARSEFRQVGGSSYSVTRNRTR